MKAALGDDRKNRIFYSSHVWKCHGLMAQAIRNAVSHGSFNLEFSKTENEYIVDFQSVLLGYGFNRKYTGSQLFLLYADYDKLRNIQELLIRIAFLKATLKLFFFGT